MIKARGWAGSITFLNWMCEMQDMFPLFIFSNKKKKNESGYIKEIQAGALIVEAEFRMPTNWGRLLCSVEASWLTYEHTAGKIT